MASLADTSMKSNNYTAECPFVTHGYKVCPSISKEMHCFYYNKTYILHVIIF